MKERMQNSLALGGALLVLIACGTVTHGTPRTVAKAPASALNVSLTIYGHFSGGNLPGTVTIEARFADASGGFALSGKQRMVLRWRYADGA